MQAHRGARRFRVSAVLLSIALALGASASLSTVPATAQEAALPGQPVVGALTGGDSQVIVNFSVPVPGTAPITGYQVLARNINDWNDASQSAVSPSSPITVTGLTNGASYAFWVTALSASGNIQSEESDALGVGIVPSFPSPPANLPPAKVGEPYSYTFNAVGAPIPTVVWVPSASPIPAGMTYDFATRTLSGTPTTPASVDILLTARNALGFANLETTLVIGAAVGEPEPSPSPSPAQPTAPAPPPAQVSPPTAPAAAAKAGQPASKARALPSTGIEPVVPFIVGSIVLALGAALILARTTVRRRRAANAANPASN